MILTPEIEQAIVKAIEARPDRPVILPSHAYNREGRVIVLDQGLPIDLHRYLHEKLIGPLGIHEVMWNEGNDPRNVNPHLFTVVAGRKSPKTHCPKGHEYAGNEMPPNSRGYRCRRCYLDSRPRLGEANVDKTKCPEGHEYTEENTLHEGNRRRCRTCKRNRSREYMRRRRAELKEKS